MIRFTRWMVAAALALQASLAAAAPVTYQFSVTGNSGPMAGINSTGFFSFDSSIIPVGGGNVNQVGLITDLSFTWDGISYTEATANTGALAFDAAGTLTLALFGTSCGAGACSITSGTNDWALRWSTDPSLPNLFSYGGADNIFDGTPTIRPRGATAPEPGTLALAGLALAALALKRRRSPAG